MLVWWKRNQLIKLVWPGRPPGITSIIQQPMPPEYCCNLVESVKSNVRIFKQTGWYDNPKINFAQFLYFRFKSLFPKVVSGFPRQQQQQQWHISVFTAATFLTLPTPLLQWGGFVKTNFNDIFVKTNFNEIFEKTNSNEIFGKYLGNCGLCAGATACY